MHTAAKQSVVSSMFVQSAKGPIPCTSGATPSQIPPPSHKNNHKPQSLPTPIQVGVLSELLRGYPKAEYIIHGFTHGFLLDFEGEDSPLSSRNSHTVAEQKDIVSEKISKERALGRIAGPFQSPPFEHFKSSPLSLRPKKEAGKYRLLHNLSYPYNETSVNFNIPRDKATVNYARLDDAIKIIQNFGPGTFLAKSDIADAFRIIPLHPSQYHLTGFKFNDLYYYDKCLPMGCSSSCRIFEHFSDALKWILETKFGLREVVKVLDDFLFLHIDGNSCSKSLNTFLAMCERVGVPTAPHKTEGPAQIMCFLGVRLDTEQMWAELPGDKLLEYASQVHRISQRTKITLRELKSVIGRLQFATVVVPHGRAFLRRLHDLTMGVKKPFYFIRISREARKDLHIWLKFLQHYSGKTIIRDIPDTDSRRIHMYSDASGWGFGATFGSQWIQGQWPSDWKNFNIAFLEFFPIYVIIAMFAEKLLNSRITFHTDNMAVVAIINQQTCKCPLIMVPLRKLVLILLLNNISLRAVHVPGCINTFCDAISRQQVTQEFLQRYGMRSMPTQVPTDLLPANFVVTWITYRQLPWISHHKQVISGIGILCFVFPENNSALRHAPH